MAVLLLVPPLHLDAVNPDVADPSEQVLELLTRRPTAVVSTIAAVAVRHAVRAVAFVEPLAGLADGGYARRCVRLLETDLAARGIAFGRVAAQGSELGGVRLVDGELLVDLDAVPAPRVGAERPMARRVRFPDAGTAMLLDEEGRLDARVVDPLVSLTLQLRATGDLDADALLDLLLTHGQAVLAAHPSRFVIARAVLDVDRPVRRLLQWPGVAARAVEDLRQASALRGLPLWWDELTVTAEPGVGPLVDGVTCRDPLVADLLDLPVPVAGRPDRTGRALPAAATAAC